MITRHKCKMENNDATSNYWKYSYPLDNIDTREESEEKLYDKQKISYDKNCAHIDSNSKKTALIQFFIDIHLLVSTTIERINLMGIFSGKGFHE